MSKEERGGRGEGAGVRKKRVWEKRDEHPAPNRKPYS